MHLVGILFPHINGDARSYSHQIKMDLKGIEGGEVNWIKLAQDRDRMQGVLKVLIKHCLPSNSRDFFSSCRAITWPEIIPIRGIS